MDRNEDGAGYASRQPFADRMLDIAAYMDRIETVRAAEMQQARLALGALSELMRAHETQKKATPRSRREAA